MCLWNILNCSHNLFFRFHRLFIFFFIFASIATLLRFYDRQVIQHRQLYAYDSGDLRFQLTIAALRVATLNSTCSLEADQRGPNQKVIGYSIFGNLSQPHIFLQYLKPFIKTLTEIPIRYPGWVVRIYHNLTADDVESWKVLTDMVEKARINNRNHIDLCNVTIIARNRKLGDMFAMTWRWLPLLDDMVETLMSRDSDSPVFPREVDAVQEWLKSDRMFHIMRDHPWHCRFIVGGCWGVKVSQGRSTIVQAAEKLFHNNHFHEYDYDQELLDMFVWPIARNDMIAHDSYCCEKIRDPSQPFPTKRQFGLFVGWREVAQHKEALNVPCPRKCRPKNVTSSLDWRFC